MNKHFLTGNELTQTQLTQLIETAIQQKAAPQNYTQSLAGKSIVTLFEKPSLRTRLSFDVGIQRLGGHCVYLDEQNGQLGKRETIADYAKNLSCWCDAIVARVNQHETLQELAKHASVPVINSLCDQFHPCQALADCLTLVEAYGEVSGKQLSYWGDGNNVARSLALYAALLGMDVTLVTPPHHGLSDADIELLNKAGIGSVKQIHDPNACQQSDIVYTDTWVSMGQQQSLDDVKATFMPYQVNASLIKRLGATAVMHCQPAHRDYEITSEVMDSDYSLCLQQAENRLFAQNALLHLLLNSSATLTLQHAS